MFPPLARFLFPAIFLSWFLKKGSALLCYTCSDGTCPYASGIEEISCTTLADTCFKFEGVIADDVEFYQGRVTRGCVAYSVLEQFKPALIPRSSCVNVTSAKDPYKRETYTGRFCLCDTDLCNAASSVFVRFQWTLVVFGVLLILFFAKVREQ